MAKVYSNKRVTLWAATVGSNPFADPEAPTDDEINALLNISGAVKWDSTDLGMQESDQIDDRVLTDEGTAQRRGFLQFGGTLNMLTPKDPADTSDIAVQAAALLRTPREDLWIVERVVYLNNSAAAVGQHVNVYKVMTDATKNQTEGDASYSYTVSLLPQGDVYPQAVTADATPVTITTAGHDTSLTVGQSTWGRARAGLFDVTNLATWTSSAPAVATVDNHGIVTGISAGSANVTAVLPGWTVSTNIAITVT